ncbi:hypothetical protein GCM10009828_058310 [Actinoplanes couchii]|uniref:Uncharacterized protein n=1 Tax=Actinoplanes couchii TaxID=403638 RepID=A0ABQ3XT66_9ACTN|nr:hypothetical protein Aco03nite_100880 [Actinoplanes couchii]
MQSRSARAGLRSQAPPPWELPGQPIPALFEITDAAPAEVISHRSASAARVSDRCNQQLSGNAPVVT